MSNTNEENGAWRTLWRESLRALSLGWELAVPMFGGVLLGYWLDRWLQTGHVFTLGLLVLGIAIGYYNVAHFIHRLNRQEDDRNQQNEKSEQ